MREVVEPVEGAEEHGAGDDPAVTVGRTPGADGSGGRGRGRRGGGGRGRRGLLVAVAVAVVAAAVGAGLLYGRPGTEREPASGEPLPPATEKAVRGDLVSEVRSFGTLQFSGDRRVTNRIAGTFTWLPAASSVVERGERLYAVDDRPVVLMRGDLPAWREFRAGMKDGKDVRMLEENLAALGYTDFTVDEEFSRKTEAALKRWQKNNGLPQSGKLELGRVVFAPGDLRIKKSAVRPGDAAVPGGEVLRAGGSRQRVSTQVPLEAQELALEGASVEIELPDGDRTDGTVASVGQQRLNEQGKKVVPVTVRLDSPGDVGKLPSADVTVVLRKVEAKNVYSVPVTALLPLPDGGFAVQIVEGGQVRRVKVRTGAFADGRAEVSGPGITEGVRVGVPRL
ncbi:peptidoglycan-binding protein [Streptomyces sp. NPDC088729]|uniref:peptidoglycan-binding protein n=1 Tax=Streptomyces sp. NPDC088729 TaxID=3365876 RepID=UPI0038054070